MCDQKIKQWLDVALKNQDLFDYKFEVDGKTDKEEGYSSDIMFITVIGKTKNGEQKTFKLAVKASKDSEKLRSQVPLREPCLQEILVYERVESVFHRFQVELGMEPAKLNPYCYATLVESNREVLIFENLKSQGFTLWNRTLPLTSTHVELVLKAYGRWHALSMALKHQQPEAFKELTRNYVNMFSFVMDKFSLLPIVAKDFQNARRLLAVRGEEEAKLIQLSNDDMNHTFNGLYFEDPDNHVILHGDCWTNNYLFKVQGDPTKPTEVRILDWQCSGLGSPAFDLCHFIFSCCDTGRYQHIKELLHVYYDSFADYLTLLGSDPEEIFPFDTLIKSWKKFSHFGLALSCWALKICLYEKDEGPDFVEMAEKGLDVASKFDYGVKDEELYSRRIANNFLLYYRSLQ